MKIPTALYTTVLTALAAGAVSTAAAATADELFDDSVVHEIRLTTHPSDWRKLRENYFDNTYYVASFAWRGIVVEDVGIRSRGNGSRSSAKPGLKVDFNRFTPGQEFLGLKSLVLDNLTQDPTFIRERLSMLMFRRMGLPAPRLAHARLIVNGAYAGLYTIVERIDQTFLKRTLNENDGYLYDYEWSDENWFEYRGSDLSAYSPYPFQAETHEQNPDARPIEQMIRTMNEVSDEKFVRAMSTYLDLNRFLDYLATETFLAEGDGLVGEWGLNNFYLYRFQGSSISTLIPWDKDVTFQEADRSIWRNMERNVLTRRVLADAKLRAYFLEALERAMELAGGPGGWLEQEIDRASEQIRTAVSDDPHKPFSYADFEQDVSHLRYFAFERPGFVANQIADSRAGNQ
ncbi:MAG: CotH kinase family protein [Bryobacteraceae bacterium]